MVYDFTKRRQEKYRIINPVSSPDKVTDKSQIEYIFDCPKCSQYRQPGDKPNKCRFKLEVGHILKCSKCWSRVIILEVEPSPFNPFDYYCGGKVIPSNKFTNIKDPIQKLEFENMLKQWKWERQNGKKVTYY